MSEDPFKLLADDLQIIMQKIKTERDELKLQIHLAKADVLPLWHELEEKWHLIQNRASEATHAAADSTKEIGEAVGLLGEELKHGYVRIREAIVKETEK